jgi:uncharacterized short protein YbdD (DUF466 family)
VQDKWELAKLKLSERIRLSDKCAGQGAQLMVGIPDDQTYVAHIARAHPRQAPMAYKPDRPPWRWRREGHAVLLRRS